MILDKEGYRRLRRVLVLLQLVFALTVGQLLIRGYVVAFAVVALLWAGGLVSMLHGLALLRSLVPQEVKQLPNKPKHFIRAGLLIAAVCGVLALVLRLLLG